VFAKASKPDRWRLGTPRGQRGGKVVEVAGCRLDISRGAHSLQWAALGQRTEERHRTASIGDLDGLAVLDEAEQFTRPLP
jgi:hypothetical protein